MKVLMVHSGKGGVGKSTIALGLACYMAEKNVKTGLIDLDLESPSIPIFTGTRSVELKVGRLIEPVEYGKIKIISLGHIAIFEDLPLSWWESKEVEAVKHMFTDVDWGNIELMVLDMPPGTGGIHYGAVKAIRELKHTLVGAVIVTTPSEASCVSVGRTISFMRQLNTPIIGVVENMAGIKCPKCGETIRMYGTVNVREKCRSWKVKYLGCIPLYPEVSESLEKGNIKPLLEKPEFKCFAEKVFEEVTIYE